MPRRLFAVLPFVAIGLFASPAIAQQATPTPAPAAHPPAPAASLPPAKPSPKASATASPTPGPPWSGMNWREIGPAASGGRIASVAGSANDPKLYYVGTAGGGVWKSTNGGQTWEAVFEKQNVSAIGAVTIDPKDDKTVWVGTGESNPRNDVSYGDGVYKTTDGGKTWKNVGLQKTRHISRILVDPNDPNHVIVGALGDVFKDSPDRGVYVTRDGGKTWSKTLYVGPSSGVSDMAMDMQHPGTAYAGIWLFRRIPYNFTSGGAEDGLYKTTDGGQTWTRLIGHGLPTGITGRIGLAVAPSNGNRVYAIIESKDGILWRSDDAGANWTMVSKDTLVDQRPFYFTHIAVDPKNPDKVYAVSEMLALSTDGGKKFKEIARDVHVDYHAIWIAPNDPDRIIVGEDGGDAITVDGGDNWFDSLNMNIGQVYHVGLSTHENPYTVCGGFQDNSAWCGPSNSLDPSGIMNKYWIQSTGGDGEWSVPDPSDPNYLWSDSENGFLLVYNKKTQDSWLAAPYLQNSKESYDLRTSKYRFNWDSPIAFAPWNGHIAWYGGNVVFQSTDRGVSWTPISPDLTRNEKSHQIPSGGPITNDVSGAEYSDTILDISGSPLHKGEIWVGTDDGLVQLTMDAGKHWRNVTPPGVPPWGRVENVSPSLIHDGTAYANVDRHRSGDYKPYLFVTHDYGRHWTSISKGLPADQYVRAVRPDNRNANVVYAGTENGMWLSLDGGKSWVDFRNNLPTVSVRDIRIQPEFDDLVIATHGRSIYVMDDIRPIQQLQQEIAQGTYLFTPRAAYQYTLQSNDEGTYTEYTAPNPPYGAMIYYYQRSAAKNPLRLEILDSSGHVIRTISGERTVNGKKVPNVPNKTGINRYVWNFRIDGPVKWLGAAKESYQGPNAGPQVPPGTYAVRMTLGGKTYTRRFSVKPDPRSQFTQAMYERSYAFGKKYSREFSNVDSMLNGLDAARKGLDSASAQAKKKNDTALQSRIAAVESARAALFSTLTADYHNDEDSIQRPGALREDMQGLGFFGSGLITPPIESYASRVDVAYRAAVQRYNAFVTSLGTLNAALKSAGVDQVKGVNAVHAGP